MFQHLNNHQTESLGTFIKDLNSSGGLDLEPKPKLKKINSKPDRMNTQNILKAFVANDSDGSKCD